MDSTERRSRSQMVVLGAALLAFVLLARRTHARIEEFAARWGGCVALAQALAGRDGRPLYEIWRFRPGGACAASAVAASTADSEAEPR